MSENLLIAIISVVGAILAAFIGAFGAIAAAEKSHKQAGCGVIGLAASGSGLLGLVIGLALATLVVQRSASTHQPQTVTISPSLPPTVQPLPPPTATPAPTAILAPTATPAPAATPAPTATPAPIFEGSVPGVPETRHRLRLSANQLIIGTADRFQNVREQESPLPPFAVFAIYGPIDEEIILPWGGWDQWRHATDNLIEKELEKKIAQTKDNHPSDWRERGINVYRCRGSISNCSVEIVPTN